MKRLCIAAIALCACASAYAQTTVAVDKDKYRNSDHAPVQWKTKRSGSTDTLVVAPDNSQATGTVRTPSLSAPITTSGTVAAGARSVTIILSSDFDGTLLTAAVNGTTDSVFVWTAPPGDTLGAFAYTIAAGSLRVVKVQ